MQILQQDKNFLKRELRISESKFYFKTSKFGNENEMSIPYENLTNEKTSIKTSNFVVLGIAGFFYCLSIVLLIAEIKGADVEKYAWLFWSIIATVFLFIFLFTRENLWKLKLVNNGHITIHKTIPNQQITDDFLTKLINSRNIFLRENYMEIDLNLNYENQLNNLKWLKSIDVITKNEFDKKYTELKSIFNPSKKIIGFEK